MLDLLTKKDDISENKAKVKFLTQERGIPVTSKKCIALSFVENAPLVDIDGKEVQVTRRSTRRSSPTKKPSPSPKKKR